MTEGGTKDDDTSPIGPTSVVNLQGLTEGTKEDPCTRTSPQFVTTVEDWGISSHFVPTNLEDERVWEFSEKNMDTNGIKFSLRNNIDFWKKQLKPSSFVLNVIEKGYILPFTQDPPAFYAENNRSSLRNKTFVEKAISELLENNFIVELPQRAFCSNPLTVAEKGKLRLVLDLRHVNQYLSVKSFRYEDLRTLTELIEKSDYFVKFDLKSGYHHVDVHPMHQKYLGFEWVFAGDRRRYFQFTVLVFGLATACYVFSKIMRPFTKRWRGMGIKSILYIDDGIGAKRSFEEARTAGKQIRKDLLGAGFYINEEKSDFIPKQEGVWLGMKIDTRAQKFSIPEEKIQNLKIKLHRFLNKTWCTPKEFSQVTGTLASMHMAIGPLVRLFTRQLYHQIERRTSWYEQIRISPEAVCELGFWLDNIEYFNGFTFKHSPTTSQIAAA